MTNDGSNDEEYSTDGWEVPPLPDSLIINRLRARVAELEAENARLRDALIAVCDQTLSVRDQYLWIRYVRDQANRTGQPFEFEGYYEWEEPK